tara:strand:+ start:625 stop:963 length:339 start_codon:yes stop_codon:yes gene_type:complete
VHAGEKRFARTIRPKDPKEKRKARRRQGKHYERPIEAPPKLDIYSAKNHRKFVQFLNEIKRVAGAGKVLFISFKNSHRITAAAGLLLVAETDRLMKTYPDLSVKCSFPPPPQ